MTKLPRMSWPAGFSVASSDDGRMLACIGQNVVVVDVQARRRISSTHPISNPSEAAFSPDGRLLVVKSTSGRILLLDPLTGSISRDCKNQKDGEGCQVLFSPDGDALIDGSWGGVLTERRVADGAIRSREENLGEQVSSISHDRSRRIWLVLHSPKSRHPQQRLPPSYLTVRRWPSLTTKTHQISFGLLIKSMKLSPDGERVCFAEWHGEQRIYVARVSDGQILARSTISTSAYRLDGLSWSTDGRHIGWTDDKIFIFFRADGLTVVGSQAVASTKNDDRPASITFLPGGEKVALGTVRTTRIADVSALTTMGDAPSAAGRADP